MPTTPVTLDALRHYAVARTLFAPTSLPAAIKRLGFVQADPIRAPARAQDLILRHRVKGYCAGDLERRYTVLGLEEDFFVNYGFLPRSTQALMHPRTPRVTWPKARVAQAQAVLAFVQERGVAHPREVDAHFAHGRVSNWFGGSTNASTQLLDGMHYRGLLRIAGRIGGVRIYAVAAHLPQAGEDAANATSAADTAKAMDALVDVIVQKYAPLPERSLRELIGMLRGGAPQWEAQRPAAFARAKARLPSAEVNGNTRNTWYWPPGESPTAKRHAAAQTDIVRLLAPFDPVVWDRRRFELLWGWAYRFEAYTPAPKRIRGYYALPLLWRDQVIGWGNLSVKKGVLQTELGYVAGQAPRDKAFRAALGDELSRMESFLNL
ncbi:MAG: crosslink repair DNA glycosylase YcaQ family protein [Polaromonas sp.]|uniref:DNA glycosylase AlkZ-like family protein n=1 Tax=Polaromonas sp. TaxID=1869339 RepID=UPI00273520E4|nr:crosslink repair DNA glycosylase YcaQ family protein [Polaromonas sp.]MDP2818499.1 crosslink repair DNA glycosylase YcaQ family protein [Polaromonas sp.]